MESVKFCTCVECHWYSFWSCQCQWCLNAYHAINRHTTCHNFLPLLNLMFNFFKKNTNNYTCIWKECNSRKVCNSRKTIKSNRSEIKFIPFHSFHFISFHGTISNIVFVWKSRTYTLVYWMICITIFRIILTFLHLQTDKPCLHFTW